MHRSVSEHASLVMTLFWRLDEEWTRKGIDSNKQTTNTSKLATTKTGEKVKGGTRTNQKQRPC